MIIHNFFTDNCSWNRSDTLWSFCILYAFLIEFLPGFLMLWFLISYLTFKSLTFDFLTGMSSSSFASGFRFMNLERDCSALKKKNRNKIHDIHLLIRYFRKKVNIQNWMKFDNNITFIARVAVSCIFFFYLHWVPETTSTPTSIYNMVSNVIMHM